MSFLVLRSTRGIRLRTDAIQIFRQKYKGIRDFQRVTGLVSRRQNYKLIRRCSPTDSEHARNL